MRQWEHVFTPPKTDKLVVFMQHVDQTALGAVCGLALTSSPPGYIHNCFMGVLRSWENGSLRSERASVAFSFPDPLNKGHIRL